MMTRGTIVFVVLWFLSSAAGAQKKAQTNPLLKRSKQHCRLAAPRFSFPKIFADSVPLHDGI